MSIIDDLVLLRKQRGLTQAELAELAGLSRMTVNKAEQQGGADPRLGTLEAMARALGMEFLVVPRELKDSLEGFVRAGGRTLAQPAGSSAPRSIVDHVVEG